MNASLIATFRNAAVAAVFNDALDADVSFASRLLAQGIGDRETARPFALVWAADKYRVKVKEGQRGLTLDCDKTHAAQRAVYRVLDVCFPKQPKPAAKSNSQKDVVEKLMTQINKLSAAERRRLIAALTK